MRLLTAISIASLVVSIAAVVFVLGLYEELEKSEPKEHTQELNETMVDFLIYFHAKELIESAGITDDNKDEMDEVWASLPGFDCLWHRQWEDISKGKLSLWPFVYEPQPGGAVTWNYINGDDVWLVTAFGMPCENVETWAIDDNTGEVTYGHPDEK